MPVSIASIGELGLIQRIKKILGDDPRVIRGIGDDAAVLPFTKKENLLFTVDAVREGTHFTLKQSTFYSQKATPFQIGWKALGVNLSDIAAMGGKPLYAVVSLGAKKEYPVTFYDQVTLGIKTLAKAFDVLIVGGDTDRSERVEVTVAMIGTVEKNRCVLRSTARIGDALLVTGTLGGSRRGKHLSFMPRLTEARTLTKNFRLTSMMDISDGLAGDLSQICRESDVGAVVEEKAIPVSKGATVQSALNDGEDFELLFTMSPRDAGILLQKQRLLGLQVSKIGKIVEKKKGISLNSAKGAAPLKGGFRHF